MLREQIGRLRVRAGIIDAQLAAGSSKVAPAILAPQTAADWFAQFQSLPEDRALIEYWLGSQGAYAWVVTPEKLSLIHISPYRIRPPADDIPAPAPLLYFGS